MTIYELDKLAREQTDHKYGAYEIAQIERMRDQHYDDIRRAISRVSTQLVRVEKAVTK